MLVEYFYPDALGPVRVATGMVASAMAEVGGEIYASKQRQGIELAKVPRPVLQGTAALVLNQTFLRDSGTSRSEVETVLQEADKWIGVHESRREERQFVEEGKLLRAVTRHGGRM